jgi:methylmalonyl-CoA/ethylmalonyl-CoA epimerase
MNGFTVNHVGLAVPCIADYLIAHRALYVGFTQTYLTENAEQQVRQAFLSDGNVTIELLEPTGPTSPLAGFLARTTEGGLVHICFNCDDIHDAVELLRSTGARLISGPTPDVAFEGRPIAFLFIKGQVVELVERPRP